MCKKIFFMSSILRKAITIFFCASLLSLFSVHNKALCTDTGKADPFFAGFSDIFDAGEWHNDMPGLNDESVILAESTGCPRQIVRYGKFAYGFQTHMEFTHDIIVAGLKDVGGEINLGGRFIQKAAELLAYDYTDMNHMLSTFLDAMMEEYLKEQAELECKK